MSSDNTTPATPSSSPFDDDARNLNHRIDQGEKKTSRLMWELGDVLEKQAEVNPGWDWDKRLSHADSLGIKRARFTRALRIRRRFDAVEDVEGRSLLDALGYKRHPDEPEPQQPKTVAPLPVAARITRKERKAAEAFCKRLASRLPDETDEQFLKRVCQRALSVLVRYGAGEMPEEDLKNQDKETRTRLREGLKEKAPTDTLKATFYDDGATQQHITDVLTVLGLVEGEERGKPQDVAGKVETETKPQDEPGEKETEHWAMSKVAPTVAHTTTDDKKAVKKALKGQKNAHPATGEQK